jgi:N-methylhydantoinase B/oxoprolinase/acetone carboxylase alpha subunit
LLVKKKGQSAFTTFSEAFGTISATKFTRVVLKEGDEVIIESPGGGGYDPAGERSTEDIEDDIRQGYISLEAAREHYAYKR